MNDNDRRFVEEISKTCANCQFFTVTGQTDSGINCPDGVTPWFYDHGTCNHPDPQLGGASPDWTDRPCWSSCYQWKRKRGKRGKKS